MLFVHNHGPIKRAMFELGLQDGESRRLMLGKHADLLDRGAEAVLDPRNRQQVLRCRAHVNDRLQRPNAIKRIGPCAADSFGQSSAVAVAQVADSASCA